MEEISVIDTLALFETNAKERQSFIDKLLDNLDYGYADPLKVHLQIKAIEDIIKQLTSLDEKTNKNVDAAKRYRSHLLEAANKYGKNFELFNAEFSIKETGSKYDYSQCGDHELLQWQKEYEAMKARIDERQNMLKTLPTEGIQKVDSNGEVYTVYPPAKSSTTSVSVKLK